MPVLDCLMAQAVSAGGGEKLLPKLGRQTDAKRNTTVKITQADPNWLRTLWTKQTKIAPSSVRQNR